MKKIYTLTFLLFLFVGSGLIAQPQAFHQEISATNIFLDTATITLAQVSINAPTTGRVEVRFDGVCVTDSGDRIIIAASDIPDWITNDGNNHMFARSADNNSMSFSHTRYYDAPVGPSTYYAVAQNYVCNDGSGYASLYGMLTVIYFPDNSGSLLEGKGFTWSGNVRGGPVVLDSVTINAGSPGIAVVHFDGKSEADEGDRVYFAANRYPTWSSGDGSVFIEVNGGDLCLNDIPFSHTRVFNVTAGPQTFYAVAENQTEMDGNGDIYTYGTLTVEFFPDAGPVKVAYNGVLQTSADLNSSPVGLAQVNVTTNGDGYSLVRFDGVCVSDSGDKIFMAGSDAVSWGPNAGSVEMEAYSNDINANSFSHTRYYPVTTSSVDYFAVGENQVEMDGSGIADVYGNLTVIYFPAIPTSIPSVDQASFNLNISHNAGLEIISFTLVKSQQVSLTIYDVTGKKVETIANSRMSEGFHQLAWNSSHLGAGIYLLKVEAGLIGDVKRIVVQR